MKTIVAGSREITDIDTVVDAIEASKFEITEVVSGEAIGVDTIAIMYAHAAELPLKKFPADWSTGKSAGYIRNEEMAKYADALIAVWNGNSPGTAHMIKMAQKYGLKIYIHKTT